MNNTLISKNWIGKSTIEEILFPFQIDALNMSSSYLESDSKDQALIKMPTGTGKTLLIGFIANLFKLNKNILIITTSKAVKNHLIAEIKINQKKTYNLDSHYSKEVLNLLPSNLDQIDGKNENNKILIGTTKALNDIRMDSNKYQVIKNLIDLVIFDEGHKEPAEEWQWSVRNLEKKVILFTATPLRNDKSKFIIDQNFIFNYSLEESQANNFIREIKFNKLNYSCIGDFINKIIKNDLTEDIKIILRFSNYKDILIAYEHLQKNNYSVIAIHHSFNKTTTNGINNSQNLYSDVPTDIKSRKENFWLHQDKLNEGIDDSSFKVLGIYGSFGDVRSLVQQVGRIIRKTSFGKESKDDKAKVYYVQSNFDQLTLWEEYCHYERKIKENNKLIYFNFGDYFKKTLSIQPDLLYAKNKFLRKISYKSTLPNVLEDIQLPLRANIYHNLTSEINIETLKNKILFGLSFNDSFIIYEETNDEWYFILFSTYRNSPFLVNQSFLEVDTNICFIRFTDKFIFINDSSKFLLSFIDDNLKHVDIKMLQRLFNERSKFSQMSIINGSISKNEISRSVISSYDLNNITPNVLDKYKFASTVTGTVNSDEKISRRYVGFKNSKLTESSDYVSVNSYLKWTDSVSRELLNNNTISIFKRYAPVTRKPMNTLPLLILLNLSSIEDYIYDDFRNKVHNIERLYKVTKSKFIIKYDNNREIEVEIRFDDNLNKYIFTSNNSNQLIINKDKYRLITLIEFLNKKQTFQVVTNSRGYIYSQNYFYETDIKKEYELIDSVLNEYKLKEDKLITEKGRVVAKKKTEEKKEKKKRKKVIRYKNDWDQYSLFNLIANNGDILDTSDNNTKELQKEIQDMDYIICDDLNYEIADFIGIKSTYPRKVYFIHCKATKQKSGVSASSFQELCGQISKNINYYHYMNTDNPPNLKLWSKEWIHDTIEVKKPRIIREKVKHTPQELWDLIKEILSDQDSEKLVWALTGNMFSLDKFNKNKNKNNNNSFIPFIFIINNTMATLQNVGFKFKVYFNKIYVR
jgi:superfamily II DNA or RNA helicase